MQGIEIEAEGSILKYVTKAEYREQRSSLPFIKHQKETYNLRAQIYTYILNYQNFRCDTYIFHRRGRSIFLKQITSVLVPSLFFLRQFSKKLPHFPNYLPRFWKNLPRFWKKLPRFLRKLRRFSRNLPAFLDNLRHSRGI